MHVSTVRMCLARRTCNKVAACTYSWLQCVSVMQVSPGVPSVLPSPEPQPASALEAAGVSYNLYNNAWGTNYIMWYPYAPEHANMKFRFTLDTSRE